MSSPPYPYVVFLQPDQKNKILSAIFGSQAALDVLKFALNQGVSNKIYQKDLIRKLPHSNKTIIENLKMLTKLGIFEEKMEKTIQNGHVIWVKTYMLSDPGKWLAMLLAKEKDLSEKEKTEILKNTFRTYIRSMKELSEKLKVKKETLKEIFNEEMK